MNRITSKDMLWSYAAQSISIASGLIVLPLIIRLLSANEIGMNYLMLTIGSLVSLFDFGFSPQFARNITYAYCGASELKEEGIEIIDLKKINYNLLSVIIKTARYIYLRLAFIVLVIMLTFGTIYISKVTNNFENVKYSFWIWLTFSITTSLNIYYTYYSSLLLGAGMIKEERKSVFLSKISYIFIASILLICGLGLFSIILANLISPFVQRIYSYKKYFTNELIDQLNYNITKNEIKTVFNAILFNTKKLGINFLGSFAINKAGFFIIGLFLPLKIVASYGLLIQLSTVLSTIAGTYFITYQPQFIAYRVGNSNELLKKKFSLSMFIYYIIMILGTIGLIFMPFILKNIGSNIQLPNLAICLLFVLILILENNHSFFATLIVIKNEVPFVKSGIISGLFIVLFTFLSLKYTNLGLLGVLLSQGICQLAYNNWRWPLWIFKDLEFTFIEFVKYGKVGIEDVAKNNLKKLLVLIR